MRYLGLDLGTKTLGISISNGVIASNYTTLRHNEEYDKLATEVKEICLKEKINEIILGLPKNMDNTLGFATSRSLNFKKKLECILDIPVIMEDERLTSKVANDIMISFDTSRKKRK